MSLREQILKLAYEARNEALKADSSVSSLLRKCYTICHMLKRDVEWIKLELFGYEKWETRGELWEHVPSYRRVHLLYRDIYGNPVLVPSKLSFLTKHAVAESIGQVESSIKGMYIAGGITDYIREQFKVPVVSAMISPVDLKGIVESVRNRALEFVNNAILELEYGDILSNIFEETRKVVDSRLVEVCPLAIEKLTKTYSDIITGSSSLEWSQIAFACRDILQDFTDSIYKADYRPEGEISPTREQTKKKLAFTLWARMPKLKDKERKLIESQIDYLLSYFSKLTDLIQKYTHPVGFEVTKEDAHRCVLYTYLVIGDILKILEL